ncbi:MAG: hypothetical protein U0835_17630 [Isosphaeraceae bacterium]
MSETVTLEIPDELARRARALAASTHRRFEDLVVDGLRQAVEQPDVSSLPDEQLHALCDATLNRLDQERLSTLLADHREGRLSPAETAELDGLMQTYRYGLVLKGKALREAVRRGIRPPLSADAS